MEVFIYYLVLIIGIIVGLPILGIIFFYIVALYSTSYKRFFKDSQVRKLCKYIQRGNTKKIDKLLTEGVDVNSKGLGNITPLLWLGLYKRKTKNRLRSLEFLLKKGADPFVQYSEKNDYNFIQIASAVHFPDYLQIFLEAYKPTPKEIDDNTSYSVFTTAIFYDRFAQFKMLIDYGINVNRKGENSGKNVLNANTHYWKYAYYLLKAGADWSNVSKSHRESDSVKPENRNRPDFLCRIEEVTHPAYIIAKNNGVDYFQKIVAFLRKQGAEFKLNLNPKERYQKVNGKEVLFYKEDGQWKEYLKSRQYKIDYKRFRPGLMERIGRKLNQF